MLYNNVSFCYPFRDYQTRVLDTLNEKLNDNKIHIVAAPGSGKTVLGLEIVRRLDIPVVVLTPSISIREQWIDRYLTLFVNKSDYDYWKNNISDSLDKPGIITVITYQALYTKYQDSGLEAASIELLKNGVKGIVLDEAHHLKREWWKALTELESFLNKPTIISLTATPPYDASGYEWTKYNNLCGEIDIELFTPEMVQKNSLAPYQDFVYLCTPADIETKKLLEENYNLISFYKEILTSDDFYKELSTSSLLTNTSEKTEFFLNNNQLLLSLVYCVKDYLIPGAYNHEPTEKLANNMINSWNKEITSAARSKVQAIRNTFNDKGTLELIFQSLIPVLIAGDNDLVSVDYKQKLNDELKSHHLLANSKFSVDKYNEKIDRILKNSSAKLSAICDIALSEIANMNDDLSMLILLDNIGKENMSCIGTSEPLSSIDCISIFENLRRCDSLDNVSSVKSSGIMGDIKASRLGVLCGSVCILPTDTRLPSNMNSKEIANTDYKQITINDTNRKSIVSFVTDLVNDRIINILVGTVSLLGEGWDAPAINTVILGSNVSSYVQSNQMRGRALRIDPTLSSKTANIWHLCTLNPVKYIDDNNNNIEETRYIASDEYRSLCNRFESLLGINVEGTDITNSIERLGLPLEVKVPFSSNYIKEYNDFSKNYASRRSMIYDQWSKINATYDLGKVRETILIPNQNSHSTLGSGQLSHGEIQSLANGFLSTLQQMELVSSKVKLNINRSFNIRKTKTLSINIDNCSSRERNLILNGLRTIICPGKYGRYVLRKGTLLRGPILLGIPDVLKNKNNITLFIKKISLPGLKLLETKSPEAIDLIMKNNIHEKRILKNILKCGK